MNKNELTLWTVEEIVNNTGSQSADKGFYE